jgi:polysaccharide biosynthesis/export protein
MIFGRMQKVSSTDNLFAFLVCLLFLVMLPGIAFAQTEDENRLESLLKEIEGPLGKSGASNYTVSPIDAARSEAAKGLVRSPFSQKDGSQHPELNTRFKANELYLIERFCRKETLDSEDRALRIMREFSNIERDYCLRVSDRILQIGYNVFDGVLTPELLVNGAIGDEYVLGIGDELVVTFEGKRSQSFKINIDREGQFAHKDLGRIRAAGKTIGEFRKELAAKTRRAMVGTSASLSLGVVRLLSVRVTGEVRRPGLHRITGLSTLFDAISIAGGIKKTGSLRKVQVKRGDRIFWLDIYELMFAKFGGQDSGVRDGDHILVPPLGHTIAVSGDVKRAGIYELAEGETSITVAEAVSLAGGYIRPKGNSLIRKSFDSSGREVITPLANDNILIESSDIVAVGRQNNSSVGTVSLEGEVSNPGAKPLTAYGTVRTLLLNNNSFGDNPYLLFGALQTTDPGTRSRRFFPLNLQEIVEGKKDYSLRDKDRLIVFSQEEINYISSDEVRKTIVGITDPVSELERQGNRKNEDADDGNLAEKLVQRVRKGTVEAAGHNYLGQINRLNNSAEQTSDGKRKLDGSREKCRGLRSLATILQFTRSRRFASVVQALGGTRNGMSVNPRVCPSIFDKYPGLLPFVMEHSVAVNGEVRMPGAYPVVSGSSLASLLAVTGGMTLDVDISLVEISGFDKGRLARRTFDLTKTNMAGIIVNPGDLARFNPLFKARDTGPVLLSGEFARPGLYDIRRGERLSEVIARAGGVTEQAFPYGAVFTRERVRVAQKIAFERAARELRSTAMYAAGKQGASANSLVALRELTDEISETESVGRVVIEADPTVLQVRPELDTVLEPGDRVFMPKRPNSVLVIGDILNPGALQFVAGTKVDQYVQQAGGMQLSADEDRMFLVYPNGVAQPVSVSVWNYNPVRVPPGSTVVVPKNPAPVNLFDFAKEMTALISQMAITAASLAVIGNN